MSIRFPRFLSRFLIAAASGVLATSQAIAQVPTETVRPYSIEPLPNLFERAIFFESEDFFTNTTLQRQIDFILGPGPIQRAAYPENEITRDALLTHVIYLDLLEQQVSSDPVLRTPDLSNPYNTSLRLNPSYRALEPVPGSQFIFETAPAPGGPFPY
ncbi:MAG: hypothetical protein ACOC3E_01525 [Cyanobacteriota bacterium]